MHVAITTQTESKRINVSIVRQQTSPGAFYFVWLRSAKTPKRSMLSITAKLVAVSAGLPDATKPSRTKCILQCWHRRRFALESAPDIELIAVTAPYRCLLLLPGCAGHALVTKLERFVRLHLLSNRHFIQIIVKYLTSFYAFANLTCRPTKNGKTDWHS